LHPEGHLEGVDAGIKAAVATRFAVGGVSFWSQSI